MRDPRRIKMILSRVSRAWEMNPDLRLGQLLVIATTLATHNPRGALDLFPIEDDVILKGINDLIAKNLKNK